MSEQVDSFKKKQPLPRYSRAEEPPSWRPTDRDKNIVAAIHDFDGMMGDYQIRRLFGMGKTQAELRLKLLYQNHWLDRPDRKQRAALDCMVYWLGSEGAAHLAGLAGLSIKEFTHRSTPHWQLLSHDLWVNDMRISILKACERAGVAVESWVTELDFWRYPRDRVTYPNEQGKKVTRDVRPDGLFSILDNDGKYRWRFLLELDRRSEDNPRIAEEKYLPGIYYLSSDAYGKRIASEKKAGRWLFVTTGERRLFNMKRRCETVVGNSAQAFYFTTYALAYNENAILTEPIWWRGGDSQQHILLERVVRLRK